jgi:aconitate hydratase
MLRSRSTGLCISRSWRGRSERTACLRVDTPIEVDDCMHGGILRFVLRQLLAG